MEFIGQAILALCLILIVISFFLIQFAAAIKIVFWM